MRELCDQIARPRASGNSRPKSQVLRVALDCPLSDSPLPRSRTVFPRLASGGGCAARGMRGARQGPDQVRDRRDAHAADGECDKRGPDKSGAESSLRWGTAWRGRLGPSGAPAAGAAGRGGARAGYDQRRHRARGAARRRQGRLSRRPLHIVYAVCIPHSPRSL